MKKMLSLVVFGLILVSPTYAFAQQNVQSSGGGVQNQTNSAQSTGSLQTPTTPTQGNNSSTLLEAQPNSLGVVGDPSKQQPSVVVGQANSKTDVADEPDNKGSVWQIILIIGVLIVIFWIFYRRVTRISAPAIVPVEEIKPELIDPKIQSKMATKKSPVKTRPKKKPKKKRAHR
jgi:hypothetical protein